MAKSARENERVNIVIVLADDMGYSDLGCFGGEIRTPNLDRLAANGLRMSQFYNTARCSPSRASLLTGLHPHQTGIGILTEDDRPIGYPGTLNDRCVTMAEVLGAAGYATYMSGKWHLTGRMADPDTSWPLGRGFHRFYGTIPGAGDYWYPKLLVRGETNIEDEALAPDFFYTDAIAANAAGFIADHARDLAGQPFFLYTAFTAPHWPLHAPPEDIAAYDGHYDAGWDALRPERARRLVELGILEAEWPMSDRDPEVPAWDESPDHDWQTRRMEIYAAQVERLDRGVGRIVEALEHTGQLDNTLICFLSDNGGCAEELAPGWVDEMERIPLHMRARTRDGRRVFKGNTPEVMPGPEETYASYGRPWANLSNTPFREYKHWVHEGGISTPFIVHWPAGGLEPGSVRHDPHQLPDMMATVLDVTGVAYPVTYQGRDVLPLEGTSMVSTWRGEPPIEHTLFWEHEGNAAVRRGPWKLVRKYPGDWELYDMRADRTELHNRIAEQPALAAGLAAAYERWAERCGVIPRDRILEFRARRRGAEAPPRT